MVGYQKGKLPTEAGRPRKLAALNRLRPINFAVILLTDR